MRHRGRYSSPSALSLLEWLLRERQHAAGLLAALAKPMRLAVRNLVCLYFSPGVPSLLQAATNLRARTTLQARVLSRASLISTLPKPKLAKTSDKNNVARQLQSSKTVL